MDKDYVSQLEFTNLSERVEKLESQNEKNEDLLLEIDKKVDIIFEKIVNADKAEELKLKNIDLKLNPIEDRVGKLENNQEWLWRSIIVTAIGLISTLISLIVALIKFKVG